MRLPEGRLGQPLYGWFTQGKAIFEAVLTAFSPTDQVSTLKRAYHQFERFKPALKALAETP